MCERLKLIPRISNPNDRQIEGLEVVMTTTDVAVEIALAHEEDLNSAVLSARMIGIKRT